MNPSQIVDQVKTKLQAVNTHFLDDLKKIRTGRAHPSMLDGIMVLAYGTSMPLLQVGTVTVPEPQLLQITPFDPSNLSAISTAIRDNPNLGLNPMDDGRVIRIPIPSLTEERRHEIVKQLYQKVEECKISARNIRHDALKEADQSQKNKLMSQDDIKRIEKLIDETMNQVKIDVDSAAKAKEQEILTI